MDYFYQTILKRASKTPSDLEESKLLCNYVTLILERL